LQVQRVVESGAVALLLDHLSAGEAPWKVREGTLTLSPTPTEPDSRTELLGIGAVCGSCALHHESLFESLLLRLFSAA
jgi:hypothetical protein